MKFHFSVILCLLLSIAVYGQKKETMTNKEQQIVEHFKNDYKKKNHKRFEGKITAKDNRITFDDKVVLVDKLDKTSNSILKQGLVYPQLLTNYQMEKFLDETTDKTQKRFLKLQKDPKASFDVNNILVKITDLNFTNPSEKVRRFKMITKNKLLPNSVSYLIELTNYKATKTTTFEDFVKDSKLTYLDQE